MAEAVKQHYITIQEFMVKDLELKGNELIAYALIYGFSQDEESYFKGSLSYVANWLNCSKTTAHSILNKLADDGFLEKKEKNINGVKLCDYMAVVPNKTELKEVKERKENRKEKEKSERRSKNLNTHSKNNNGRSKKCDGYPKNLNEGVQKTVTHNNTDILNDIKDENIDDNLDKYALKDLSFKDCDNMYASVSGKQEGEQKPKKKSRYIPKDYTEEQLREHIRPTIRENFERIEFKNGLGHIADGEKLLEDITVEFFRQYEENMGVKHNILPDKSYINVIRMFVCSTGELREYFDIETYEIMIKRYFETDFNRYGKYDGEVTLCLSHFMNDTIRNNLLNREGILWERVEEEDYD